MASRTGYSTWTPQMSTLFSGHYLRNRSTLDIGVLGYISIVQHKEHSPEVLSILPGTPCIYIYMVLSYCRPSSPLYIQAFETHRFFQAFPSDPRVIRVVLNFWFEQYFYLNARGTRNKFLHYVVFLKPLTCKYFILFLLTTNFTHFSSIYLFILPDYMFRTGLCSSSGDRLY